MEEGFRRRVDGHEGAGRQRDQRRGDKDLPFPARKHVAQHKLDQVNLIGDVEADYGT